MHNKLRDRQTYLVKLHVVWSVQLGLLGLSQGTTTVAELGSPSEQGLNAGWRVGLCDPGSIKKDEAIQNDFSFTY